MSSKSPAGPVLQGGGGERYLRGPIGRHPQKRLEDWLHGRKASKPHGLPVGCRQTRDLRPRDLQTGVRRRTKGGPLAKPDPPQPLRGRPEHTQREALREPSTRPERRSSVATRNTHPEVPMVSYSHWKFIEACRGCAKLLDTSADDHEVLLLSTGERRYWHSACLDRVRSKTAVVDRPAA